MTTRRSDAALRGLSRRLCCLLSSGWLFVHAAPSPAFAEPAISVSTAYYDIVGTTLSDLVKQMQALGPKDQTDHIDGAGDTTWSTDQRLTYRTSASSCAIKDVFVSVTIKYLFPRWENESGADQATRQAWDRFLSALRTHEAGHARHGEDSGREIEQALRNLVGRPTCEDLDADAVTAIERITKKYEALDVEYDRVTKHGLTQGTEMVPGSFGAIAYDDGSRAYGWDYGAESVAAADRMALSACARRASDCKIVARFSKGCAALATGAGSDFGTALADNRDEAEAGALTACKRQTDSCIVATSACASP